MKLKTIENYEIYTDASFEDVSKLATYSVVITSEGKILEVFSKRCKLDAQKSTEVEIFGIYQAMSLILMKYLNQNKYQTFLIKTDCRAARDFFVNHTTEVKAFEYRPEIAVMMMAVYQKLAKKLARASCSFKIKWISEKDNQLAHKYTYQTFQMVKRNMQLAKENTEKNEIVVIEKRHLVNIMNELSKNQRKILCYLMEMPKENGMLEFDREKIATKLNLSIRTVTRAVAVFRRLNIIGVKHKESYEMLI